MPLTLSKKLLKMRRTKIIATIGPASNTPEVLEQLFAKGVNVVRLNMSHGNHEMHARSYKHVRELAKKMGLPIAVLVDLSGPKMRCGKFVGGQITLEQNASVVVTVEDVLGKPGLIPSQYIGLVNDVTAQNHILLNDGALELRVESVSGKEIKCRVITGGVLKDHKGINLPGVKISASALTEKDKIDAIFGLNLGADYIALSFVQRASDIIGLRTLIQQQGASADIIAKIEKPEALEDIDAILDASDAIMIARGDLGVEASPEDVPSIQDQLIVLAREKMKPIIVATQMLESMITNPKPTRAEVTDVSHAVNSSADAVMLSAETASGQYPVQAIEMMDRIARRAEEALWREGFWGEHFIITKKLSFSNAMAVATSRMSKDLMAHSIMVATETSSGAIFISSSRPASPIVAIVDNDREYQRMALVWGVIPVLCQDNLERNVIEFAKKTAVGLGLAVHGDCILLVKGFNDNPSLNLPSITIITV